VTGLTHPRLLRASHIKPWAECTTDAERLDPENGLLLAAHLDAAFDAFLVSFDREGALVCGPGLSKADREALGLRAGMGIGAVGEARWGYLAGHLGRTLGG
jgi:putative restriction endonuclease